MILEQLVHGFFGPFDAFRSLLSGILIYRRKNHITTDQITLRLLVVNTIICATSFLGSQSARAIIFGRSIAAMAQAQSRSRTTHQPPAQRSQP